MALELTKGTALPLTKEGSTDPVKKLRLGLGWDVAAGKTIDLDAWLVPVGAAPLYFATPNKEIPGAKLDKDDTTGASSADGADENIHIDFDALTQTEYFVVINIFDAVKKGQFFKDVERAFVEIEDTDTKTKIFNYNISENGGDNFTLLAGKLVKINGSLEFTALSEFSTKDQETFVKDLGGVV